MLVSGDIPAHGKVSRLTYYRRLTPFSSFPSDRVFTVSDLMSEADWEESEYYQSSCKQQDVFHVLGANILVDNEVGLRLRITRPKSAPDFSDEEKLLCQMLIPHFRRVFRIRTDLGCSSSLRELYADTVNRLSVATIVLNEAGEVHEVNEYARSLLETGDGLRLVGNRIRASYPSADQALQHRIREALDGRRSGLPGQFGTLSVDRPSGEVNLGIFFEVVQDSYFSAPSSQPALVLYVRDSVNQALISPAAVKELFDFTSSEAALVIELANGVSLESAAEHLKITRNTARSHLRSIFSKTGVRRQAELVRIVLNSVVALRPDGFN